MERIHVPLGIDSFEKLRANGYYYIDKTLLISELLMQEPFEVNLITRPRRFGKTLTMSMLAEFFDIRKDSRRIFQGLAISQNTKLCEKWMNRWPVLSVTFKDIDALTFEEAYDQLADTISDLCVEHAWLLDSEQADEDDKKRFAALKAGEAERSTVRSSLYLLTRMMKAHYGRPVIFLLDEYDVPLAKASEHGYYQQMQNLIAGMLGKALKTNCSLKFAVVTGCLRIAKASIFTGTNHFISNSISGPRYQTIFGFTPQEAGKILSDTGFGAHALEMKQWYDGYRTPDTELYCPWDVLNYVSDLQSDPDALPGSYWKDSSHNAIIRSFIGQKDFDVSAKLETLLSGGYIKVRLCDDLTYDTIHSSEENFWSILYLTGYLTRMESGEQEMREERLSGRTCLKIPNKEIRTIFAETIAEWFTDNMKTIDRRPLMDALWDGKEDQAAVILSDLLFQTISYHNYREDFYHAFLSGIFVGLGYAVESDKEHGEGRPDMLIKDKRNRRAMIIETKRSDSEKAMEKDCRNAVDQIAMRRYAQDCLDGYQSIRCYGAAFYKKQCLLRQIEIMSCE